MHAAVYHQLFYQLYTFSICILMVMNDGMLHYAQIGVSVYIESISLPLSQNNY